MHTRRQAGANPGCGGKGRQTGSRCHPAPRRFYPNAWKGNKEMSKPAKDEAELLEQVVLTTCECHPGECYVKMGQMLCCAEDDKVEAVFAAIRKAGWTVVPRTAEPVSISHWGIVK
jgi:hypothetical protein